METTNHNNHQHKHFSPVSFIAGLLIALSVFFAIYKLVQSSATTEKHSVVKDSVKVKQSVAVNKKEGPDFTEEHFYKSRHHRHIDEDAETIVVAPGEMSTLEKGNLTGQQKKLLELLPNAPVIYIFDLKITDYQTLYFNAGIPVVLENKKLAGQVLHDALKDFSEKKFAACFNNMAILFIANDNDVNALFYGGMASYYNKNYTEAYVCFEKVISSKNNTFWQEGGWFMAMALLENNKKEKAKKLLEEIVAAQGFYADRAAEKLKQL